MADPSHKSGYSGKRVVIAHGWADDPTKGWISWLARELKAKGIEAKAPVFPDPKHPDVEAWTKVLTEAVGQPDSGLVLVGHSLGCGIILGYLSQLKAEQPIAGLILVAGGLPRHRPEILADLDLDKVKRLAPYRVCIYSDNDEWVKPERSRELARLLEAEVVIDRNKGHFAGLHGVNELPSVLRAIQNCYYKLKQFEK